MTQAQATALAAPIVELFNEMEDVLLKKIAKQLGRDGDLSDASKWRMRQLARAGLLDKEAVKTIRSYTGIQSDMLDIIIETAALHEIDHLDSAVRAADAAALSGVGIPSAEDTAYNAMKAFRRQAQQDINAVNTVMRYKTKQAFVTAVNEAFWDAQKSQRVYNALGMGTAEVITGAESLQTGIRDAISKLSEKGIPAFIDKAGREWSPEAYVRMDIRSTVGNTARQAQWDRCLEHGINLIEVDAHSGARPLCAPYQGRIYSIDGTSGKAKDGSGIEFDYVPIESTSFGKKAGLFGINCGHHNYPFKAGINFKRYYPLETKEQLAINERQYAQSQKQRYYERQIRKAKKDCMMQDAAKNEEGFVKASQKLARRKEAYSDYCKSAGLRKDNKRTQVYGFDKSISSKATWANKKAKIAADSDNLLKAPSIVVDKSTKSGYNLNIQDSVSNAKYYLDSKPKNKCAEVLRSQLDQAELEARTLKDAPYAISKSNHKIYFDPDNPYFSDYNPTISILHETAHRADLTIYHAADNESFSQAVLDTVMSTDRGKLAEAYNSLSTKLKGNVYLSDIMSAVTENDDRFVLPAKHSNEYWLKTGNKESEIFANLFTLEATSDTETINFVKNNLSILYSNFANMI